MEGNMGRCRTPKSLQYLASEAAARYITNYCHIPIYNYGWHHGLGDVGREVRDVFVSMRRDGMNLQEQNEFLNQYGRTCEVILANTYRTQRQSIENFVEYLRRLKDYIWEESPLGHQNSILRKLVSKSLLKRLQGMCMSPWISFIIQVLFCLEIPQPRNKFLQFSREEDTVHFAKILKKLTPYYLKEFDSRWLESLNCSQPMIEIITNADHLEKMVFCGTKHLSQQQVLFMSLTNLTEIGLDMEEISQGPNKVDLFSLFFFNQIFPEVVTQLANGRECKMTFPNLKRLSVMSCLNQNTRYFFYCLLHMYGKLITNVLHCGKEKQYTKDFIIFSKVGQDNDPGRCSRDFFPLQIQQKCGVEFVFYNIIEQGFNSTLLNKKQENFS